MIYQRRRICKYGLKSTFYFITAESKIDIVFSNGFYMSICFKDFFYHLTKVLQTAAHGLLL